MDELNLDSLIERVQKTHSKYIEEKERFAADIKAANEEKQTLSTELETANTKINELSASLEDANKNLEATKAELAEMTSKDEVNQILSNDAAVYKELQNKYASLENKSQNEITQLTDKITELESTIASLNKNSENYNIYAEDLKNEIQEKTTALASLNNKYADLENAKKDVDTAFLELKEKHNKSIEDHAETENKIAELESQLESLRGSNNDSNVTLAEFKGKTLGSIKHLVEDVIEPQEAKIEALTKEVELANSAKAAADTKVAELNNIISNFNEKINSLTRDISIKDTRIVDLTQQISELSEKIKELTPVRQTHTHLQDYIDSTIPIPENTAAAASTRQVKNAEDLSNAVVTPFGKVSPNLLSSVTKMIDELFRDKAPNQFGEYSLNNALQSAENVGLSVSTGNLIMDRLQAMNFNGKPIVIFRGNVYYATIDKETLKNYVLKG